MKRNKVNVKSNYAFNLKIIFWISNFLFSLGFSLNSIVFFKKYINENIGGILR